MDKVAKLQKEIDRYKNILIKVNKLLKNIIDEIYINFLTINHYQDMS